MRSEIGLNSVSASIRDRFAGIASLAPTALVFATVVALSFAHGGYFDTSWGWLGVGLAWLTAIAIAVEPRVRLARLELVWLAGLLALLGWVALSTVWADAVQEPIREAQRALVYTLGALAALLLLRFCSARQLLGSLLAAIALVSTYGLSTRLFPERIGNFSEIAAYRLSEPFGYWNALGIFTAIGALLALGFAARGNTVVTRALAGAAMPLLAATLFFTYSRGAWIALGIGLLFVIVLDPRRLQLLTTLVVLAPWPILAVWLGSRPDALTRQGSELAEASREGHRFALIVIALAAAAGIAMALLTLVERRVRVPQSVRLVVGAALLALCAAALSAVFVRYGGPVTLVERGYNEFKGPPVGITTPGSDLNRRVLSLSGNGRYHTWRVALGVYEDHPWVGTGAGSYEKHWFRERPIYLKVRDAHGLYFEWLAELGVIGTALLLLALLPPLAAAVLSRGSPLLPAAGGAYVAFLTHAGVDWDWEMPVVILTALACGAALLVSARGRQPQALSAAAGFSTLAVIAGLGLFAFVGLIGNNALEVADEARDAERWSEAESEARKAIDWMPWSSGPWELLGDVQLERGQRAAAQVSFQKAIEKDEGDWPLWLKLAEARSGNARRGPLREARRLNPRSVKAAELQAELASARRGGRRQ